MTRREIATVACQILALAVAGYGWVCLIQGLPYAIYARNASFAERLLIQAIPAGMGIAFLLVGWVMWRRASVYAERMTEADPTPVTTTGLSSGDVLSLACCVIGIWISAPAVMELLKIGVKVVLAASNSDDFELSVDNLLWMLAPEVVRFASGLYMILGARGISNAIRKWRSCEPLEAASASQVEDTR